MKKRQTLYCFSPPVMIATFIIEIVLFVWAGVRYKASLTRRLAMAMLLFLAMFQLAEFFVCGGLGVDAATWSRLGYVAITTLPPLGLHLIATIAGYKPRAPIVAAYVLGLAWIAVFGFSEGAFTGHQCAGNYVIFQLRSGVGGWYFVYYYALLFAGMALAASAAARTRRKKTRQALHGMIAGYLVFLVPTTIVNTLNPATLEGIPSIMCGFAVLYALTLFFYVLPRVSRQQ
jgi:hypothetical protein